MTENAAARALPSPKQLDRLRELVSIGAGHAATAFGTFVGRTFSMRVPTIRLLRPETAGSTFVTGSHDMEHGELAGIFFEVDGGLGGLVAFLLPAHSRDRVLELLLGQEGVKCDSPIAESALRELGNILVSHVVSAISDTLGEAVLPSVPMLSPTDGNAALTALLAHVGGGGPLVRVETEIEDRGGELYAVLVLVPDLDAIQAERRRGTTTAI